MIFLPHTAGLAAQSTANVDRVKWKADIYGVVEGSAWKLSFLVKEG